MVAPPSDADGGAAPVARCVRVGSEDVDDERDETDELDGDGAEDPGGEAWAGAVVVVVRLLTGSELRSIVHVPMMAPADQRHIISSPSMCDR